MAHRPPERPATSPNVAESVIARTWRGSTRAEDSERYLDYLRQTGLEAYRQTDGNLGVLALRRIAGDRAEFLLISLWKSREAIRGFAGDDISAAVFYPEDDAFLVDCDLEVSHFEVVFRSESTV